MATDPSAVQAQWDKMFPDGAAVQWLPDPDGEPISFKVPYVKVLSGTSDRPRLLINDEGMPHPMMLDCSEVERVRTNPVLVLRLTVKGASYPVLIGANIPPALADDTQWRAARQQAIKEDYSSWL